MADAKTVSIVIPVYNERPTIETLIRKVKQAVILNWQKEIILVDDCSTDGTTEFLRTLNDPSLKIIYQPQNQGKGAALKIGFQAAEGEIVVVQDADLEYDPAELVEVLKPFEISGAEVVYGSRYLRPSPGLRFWHSWFNQLFTKFGNLFTGLRITDVMTCYKAFSRPALMSFRDQLESQRFGFEPEVTARIARAGYQIVEVPISYQPRSRAEGKHMSLLGELECLWVLIKYSMIKK